MKQCKQRIVIACWAVLAVTASGATVRAHNGPPFPIVSDRIAGSYQVSLWADPDASDDGSAEGRFWVMVNAAQKGTTLPPDTLVNVSIWPADLPDSVRTAKAEPVEHEATRRFAAFVIDREGRYGVKATIEGPLGPAQVETSVDAAYDQRPQPFTVVLFLVPFLLVGFPLLKWVLRRRGHTATHVI
jgi:hypothetical protein